MSYFLSYITLLLSRLSLFFFFNDTATTEIYTLSLHDALPICRSSCCSPGTTRCRRRASCSTDRKSTRLNSSHSQMSYAVFCLKKKKNQHTGRIVTKKKKEKKNKNTIKT